MRTTLDIDDDVLIAVKGLARRSGKTAGKVLSELARSALTGLKHATGVGEENTFYGFKPLAANGRIVSNDEVDRLRGIAGV